MIVDPDTVTDVNDRTSLQEQLQNTPPIPLTEPAPPTPVPVPPVPVPPVAPVPDVVPTVPVNTLPVQPADLRSKQGYPDDGDDNTTAVYDVFAKNNVPYDTMKLLLSNTLSTGNLDTFTSDMQGILAPVDAGVAKVLLTNVRDNAYAATNAANAVRHDAAGGKAAYDNMVAWAAGTPETQSIIDSLDAQQNPTIQKVLVGNLMLQFTNSGNNVNQAAPSVQTTTVTGGANVPQTAPLQTITQRQYAEALWKLTEDGVWDGTQGNEPAEVIELHKRAFNSKLHIPEQK